MRAFLGIRLVPPDPLDLLLKELGACGADLKVVPGDRLHLTLKFLGEIPEAQASAILARLREVPFPRDYNVEVQGVGAFPDWKRLNILWAGLRDPDGNVARSYALAEQAFAALGFPPEPRPYTPHVTLARKRTDRNRDAARRVLEARRGQTFGEARITAPELFQSTLTPDGPVYQSLGSVAP